MTKDELISLLQKHEWKHVEFKAARSAVPKDAFKTVSAFANTKGGHLVFGVSETDTGLEVTGVEQVDKVQNDFLSALRSGDKFKQLIEAVEELFEHEGHSILVFYIPESSRLDKPVYLNGDLKQSYIRRGAGDEKCTPQEVARFLRDADESRWEAEPFTDADSEDFYDEASLKWYRRIYERDNAERYNELSDVEFLDEWGLLSHFEDQLVPTRAAVLLFGQGKHVRKLVGRPVVDYQRCDVEEAEWSPEIRWNDRLAVEDNLIQAWRQLLERFHQLSEHKFGVDAETMRRTEDPPDYISFREALINLLIHQDYGDVSRTPRFKIFSDRSIFWNPGDAYDTTSELLDATEKQLRNPCIVSVFRRVGLSDQAGTGIRTICKNWHTMGHQPPILNNDKSNKAFELTLTKLPLITERQKLFQAQIGVHLEATEADVFAHICEHGQISIVELKSIVCRTEKDCIVLIQRLVNQVIVSERLAGELWGLAEHLSEVLGEFRTEGSPAESLVTSSTDQAHGNPPSLVTSDTDQAPEVSPSLVTPKLTKLTEKQRIILKFCDVPQPKEAIMAKLGVSHRSHFQKHHLGPLIAANLVKLAFPDTPTHPDQTYCITEHGLTIIAE